MLLILLQKLNVCWFAFSIILRSTLTGGHASLLVLKRRPTALILFAFGCELFGGGNPRKEEP
jgi:hypothetical protein